MMSQPATRKGCFNVVLCLSFPVCCGRGMHRLPRRTDTHKSPDTPRLHDNLDNAVDLPLDLLFELKGTIFRLLYLALRKHHVDRQPLEPIQQPLEFQYFLLQRVSFGFSVQGMSVRGTRRADVCFVLRPTTLQPSPRGSPVGVDSGLEVYLVCHTVASSLCTCLFFANDLSAQAFEFSETSARSLGFRA